MLTIYKDLMVLVASLFGFIFEAETEHFGNQLLLLVVVVFSAAPEYGGAVEESSNEEYEFLLTRKLNREILSFIINLIVFLIHQFRYQNHDYLKLQHHNSFCSLV